MKKLFLMSTVAVACFFACSKDNKGDEPGKPTPDPKTINVKDPKELTSVIKVYHGTLANGAFPAASGAGAPALSAAGYTGVIPAVSGRYAVIPLVLNVADGQQAVAPKGAYAKIAGADSYFDIDFSKPITGRQAGTQHGGLARDVYADSVIMIKLPENISNDTFRVELAVYNAQKQVSNKITVAVVTIAAGGGTANSLLQGTWTTNRVNQDTATQDWKPAKVDRIDSGYLVCVNGKMTTAQATTPGAKKYYLGEYHDVKNEFTFGAAGQGSSEFSKMIKNLDEEKTTCDKLAYVDRSYGSKEVFGWSYNTNTQLMTLVYESDDFDFEVIPMKVENNKLYVKERLAAVTEFIKK